MKRLILFCSLLIVLVVGGCESVQEKIDIGSDIKRNKNMDLNNNLIGSFEYKYENINTDKLFYCNINNDCVSVTGCCVCSELGNRIAINKDYGKYWGSRLASECSGISCAHEVSQEVSCRSKPKCVNNVCVLIDEGNNVVEVKDKIKNEYCKTSYYKKCELGNFSHGFDETLVVYGLSCREALELCGGKYA